MLLLLTLVKLKSKAFKAASNGTTFGPSSMKIGQTVLELKGTHTHSLVFL
jgi:hypothetical protein